MNYKEAKEEIKNRISIVEVVKEYVPLRRSGSNYIGLCPFHADKNPSMSVSDEKKIFKCFACREGGDVFHFLEKILNITYYEAVLKLAKQLNIQIDSDYKSSENYKKIEEKKNQLYELHKDVANTYYKFLYSDIGKNAYAYLTKKRKLTDETIKKFGLGYAPRDGSLLYNILKEKSYSDELLIESTLYKLNEQNKMVNYFFDRVIFPVIDINRHIIGFQSRVLDPNQKEFKYLNSKSTMIFKKDSILFGYNFAFNSELNYYILCEGNMDVITLNQAGYDNAMAAQGTAFNDNQIFLLKRKPKKIFLCQDMDEAGILAKNHIADMLNKNNFETYMIDLSPVKDVDEFINTDNLGVKELEKRFENPIPSILYYVSTAKMNLNLDDPYDYEKYLKLVVEKLASIENAILRESYIKKAAKQENIDANKLNSLVNEFLKGNSVNHKTISSTKFVDAATENIENEKITLNSKGLKVEMQFIYLCFMNPNFRDKISSAIEVDEIKDDICKILYAKYLSKVKLDEIYEQVEQEGKYISERTKDILNNDYGYDDTSNTDKTINLLNDTIRKIKVNNLESMQSDNIDDIYERNVKIKKIFSTSFIS